jgi:hypothetical protein
MGAIMITIDDNNGNVTMGMDMAPEEAVSLLAQAVMKLVREHDIVPKCDCPPGTHDDALADIKADIKADGQLIAPPNDFAGLATSLRRAKELDEEKARHD